MQKEKSRVGNLIFTITKSRLGVPQLFRVILNNDVHVDFFYAGKVIKVITRKPSGEFIKSRGFFIDEKSGDDCAPFSPVPRLLPDVIMQIIKNKNSRSVHKLSIKAPVSMPIHRDLMPIDKVTVQENGLLNY